MPIADLNNEQLLIAALKCDSHEAFVKIFHLYYDNLVQFTARYINDLHICEDIVQDAFVKVWAERRNIKIHSSIRTYLISLVHNLALNELRRQKVKDKYMASLNEQIMSLSPEDHMFYSELNQALNDAIKGLDPDVRQTLLFSRIDRLKHHEIAAKLGISLRTVESRINKAMKILHSKIDRFKYIIIVASSYISSL